MRRLSAVLVATLAVAGAACSDLRSPSPQIPIEAYGGMGDRMAECMRYASESSCERQVWGGGAP